MSFGCTSENDGNMCSSLYELYILSAVTYISFKYTVPEWKQVSDMHVGMLCSSMTISATPRNSSEAGGGGMLEYSLAYERELESTTLV